MKIKHSLFATLLVLSTLSTPHLFAQSTPPTTPISPEHKAIDTEVDVFLTKLLDKKDKGEMTLLGDEDPKDGSYPGYYVSGVGACWNNKLKDTLTLKKGEYVCIALSRPTLEFSRPTPITPQAWQLTGNQLTGFKKLTTYHTETETSVKTWNDYLDEAPADSSTILSTLTAEDCFILKAITPGEFTLHFTITKDTPTEADPKKKSTQSAYFAIEVTE